MGNGSEKLGHIFAPWHNAGGLLPAQEGRKLAQAAGPASSEHSPAEPRQRRSPEPLMHRPAPYPRTMGFGGP